MTWRAHAPPPCPPRKTRRRLGKSLPMMSAPSPRSFAPGTSPFHAKGLVYSGAKEYWERVVPGGAVAVHEAVASTGDARLAKFIEGPFLAGGWYDVLPIVPLSATAARLCNIPHAQLVRENGAWLARRDLRGVYRVLLALSSVAVVASRLGNLSMRYFDFGRAETQRVGDHALESHRFGIPTPLSNWFIFAAEGFVPVALQLAGAKDVTIRHGHPHADGMVSGTPAVHIQFDIQWS
jgi:hypothetical protein